MGEPFGLVVRHTLKPGSAAAFDELAADALQLIRAREPGTLVYAVHRVADEPQVRLFYELYRDRDAFNDHEAQPHTRHFLQEREQHLEGLEVTFLSLIAAKGAGTTERVDDSTP
jgi:quinol monooxygenase YgiN